MIVAPVRGHDVRGIVVKALLAKAASAASKGAFERYKTTHDFDSTVANPQWLG